MINKILEYEKILDSNEILKNLRIKNPAEMRDYAYLIIKKG